MKPRGRRMEGRRSSWPDVVDYVGRRSAMSLGDSCQTAEKRRCQPEEDAPRTLRARARETARAPRPFHFTSQSARRVFRLSHCPAVFGLAFSRGTWLFSAHLHSRDADSFVFSQRPACSRCGTRPGQNPGAPMKQQRKLP